MPKATDEELKAEEAFEFTPPLTLSEPTHVTRKETRLVNGIPTDMTTVMVTSGWRLVPEPGMDPDHGDTIYEPIDPQHLITQPARLEGKDPRQFKLVLRTSVHPTKVKS